MRIVNASPAWSLRTKRDRFGYRNGSSPNWCVKAFPCSASGQATEAAPVSADVAAAA